MKINRLTFTFTRLLSCITLGLGIGVAAIAVSYDSYWNRIIFKLQTVEFNILHHTLSTRLSYLLIKNEWEEIQETLDSNYALFGLVVTDSEGEKILAASGSDSILRSWNSLKYSSNYDRLLNPPPVRSEWKYEEPNALELTPTGKVNEGEVIGRVYYVRNTPPSLRFELSKFFSNPFSENEQFLLYRLSMGSSVGGGFLLWILIEFYFYRKRVKDREAEAREHAIEEQNQIRVSQFEERIKELEKIYQTRELEIQEIKRNAGYSSLNSQKLAVDESVEKLSRQIDDLKSQLDSAKQENLKSQNRLAAIEQERIQINQALAEAEKRIREQELIDNTQQRVLEEAQRDRDRLQERIHKLEIEKDQLSVENTTVDELERKLRITEEEHNSEIKKQNEIITRMSQDKEELQRKMRDRESEMEQLREQISLLREEMGEHDLNTLEQNVKDALVDNFGEDSVLVQFDVALPNGRRKITDFIVGLENCVVIIEAKNYSGRITAQNPRNGRWFCRENVHINASYGDNPYKQVNNYIDSLRGKSGCLIREKSQVPLICGQIVFPSNSEIDPGINNEFNNGVTSGNTGGPGNLVMVAKLSSMMRQLNNIDTSISRNRSQISGRQLIERLHSNQ